MVRHRDATARRFGLVPEAPDAPGRVAPPWRARALDVATAAVTLVAIVALCWVVADVPSAYAGVHGERWAWLAPAAIAAAAVYLGTALCLSGAVPRALPFLRTAGLEAAEGFTTVATPGGVGSFALTIRYLQRQGLDLPAATSSASLASVSTLLVDLVAIVVAALCSAGTFDVANLTAGVHSHGWELLAGVLVLATAVTLVLRLPRLRAKVADSARRAGANLAEVAHHPRRAARLLLGRALAIGLLAACLAACLAVVHQRTSVAVLVVVTQLAVIAQKAVPVPGALGAPEAVIVAGLTAAGLANPQVVAATLSFRLLTYWLPAVPGFFGIRHYRHRGYL